MRFLGINAIFHDPAAVLVVHGDQGKPRAAYARRAPVVPAVPIRKPS